MHSHHFPALFRTFSSCKRGAVAVVFAFSLVPMIAFGGLAVDASRSYLARSALQNALDAAALVGAKNLKMEKTERNALIEEYFKHNWRPGFLGSDAHPVLTIEEIDGGEDFDSSIRLSASVTIPTTLIRVLDIDTVSVSTRSEAIQPEKRTYEIALALDTTASMAGKVDGVRRVDAMKAAATEFVDYLFTAPGDDAPSEKIDGLSMSVVPFTALVNVGNQHTNFLAPNSTKNVTWDWPHGKGEWRGCVFERSFYGPLGNEYKGNDLTDAPPSEERYWPYHVTAPISYELMQACKAAPKLPPPVSPPPPPKPPTPPAPPKCYETPVVPCDPCMVDGEIVQCPPGTPTVCYGPKKEVPCKEGMVAGNGGAMPAGRDFAQASTSSTSSASLPAIRPQDIPDTSATGFPACPLAETGALPSVSHGLVNIGPYKTFWTGYSRYEPFSTYVNSDGIRFFHPPPHPNIAAYVKSLTWNKDIPALRNNSIHGSNNVDTGQPICCYGGYNEYVQGVSAWTSTGRWISPWPTTNPKFGGWGNSGCGIPLLPLTDRRSDVLGKINDIDIISTVKEGGTDISQYQGTLLHQGLAWAWRTISPRWAGDWKNEHGGKAIAPKNYGGTRNIKAVVVLTDGLNFLADPQARKGWPSYASWFNLNGTEISLKGDSNVSFYGNNNRKIRSTGVDNSAYGLLRVGNGSHLHGGHATEFCRLRLAAFNYAKTDSARRVDEDVLAVWGCREHECMLRDSSGKCLGAVSATTADTNNAEAALVGPYWDELERRMVATCNNMRKEGVRPYFILFNVADGASKDRSIKALQSCSAGRVYDAADTASLQSAFRAIANDLNSLRLTK